MQRLSLSQNEKQLLHLVRRRGAMPRAALAGATGLSAQGVTNISRRLIDLGLLTEGAAQRGRVGQPSVPLAPDPDGALFFGLKIGRRLAELALVDFAGHVRMLRQEITPHPDPDRIRAFALGGIESLTEALPPPLRDRIAGLGIAAPFRLWDWGRDFAVWRGRSLRDELAEALPFPVLLENDASTACGAELVFGAPDLPADFLYFYVAHYAGGGLVLDGRLRLGPHGNAGAIGSMPRAGGGQLLDVASVSVLERLVGQDLPPDDNGWHIPPAIEAEWSATAGEAMAFSALSAAALCDLSAVVIDGAVPAATRARLLADTGAALARLSHAGLDLPALREGSLGRHARILGAAALPLAEIFLPAG